MFSIDSTKYINFKADKMEVIAFGKSLWLFKLHISEYLDWHK